jgi:hypothetical protein
MTQTQRKSNSSEHLIKFYVPGDLKRDLKALAASRNVALSALLRLVVSEYVKSKT